MTAKRRLIIILTILASGFLLRFYGAWLPFIDDAPDWIRIINDISITKSHFHIPIFGSYHGPLTVYLLKTSSLLFGESMVGWRFMNILFSTAHLLLIYWLVRKEVGEEEAIVTISLASFNVFLIWRTHEAVQETFLLFFSTLLLLSFWKVITTKKAKYMYLTGILFGLGALTKEVIILLVPPFFLFLLFSKENRQLLKRKELYLAMLIPVLIAMPYIWWNYGHEWLHFRRFINNECGYNNIDLIRLTPTILFLYLGALLFRFPISPLILWHDSFELSNAAYVTYYNYGNECMNPLMGFIALAGIIFCIRKKEPFIRLILLITGAIFISSLFIVNAEPRVYSIIIVPSLVAASVLLVHIWKRSRIGRIFLIVFVSFIFLDAARFTLNIDKYCFTTKYASVKYQGIEERIKLHILSKAFINLAKDYKPTLVVFPDPKMDSLANYFTSYSKIKTIDCLPENKYLHYEDQDLSRILVLLTSLNIDHNKYTEWAKDNKYNIFSKDRMFSIDEKQDVRAPVGILLFTRNENTGERPRLRRLISLSNP